MATVQDIMARAQSLKQETALNSITPERAGGIMYDTAALLNQQQLQGTNPLLISKIYASIEAMEADDNPVSDITGEVLRAGQIVVISTSQPDEPDEGLVYRFNGIVEEVSSWTCVGKIGSSPYLEGYQFMGKAVLTPTPTDPGVPTQKVFYQATEPGTYTNFGGIVVADGEVVNLKWDGTAWSEDVVVGGPAVEENAGNGGYSLIESGAVKAVVASQDKMMEINNALVDADFSTLTRVSTISGKVATDTGLVGSGSYDVWVYAIEAGKNYVITGAFAAGINRRFVYYSSDAAAANIVGWDKYVGSSESTATQKFAGPLTIPQGASYILLNIRAVEAYSSQASVSNIERSPLIKVKDALDRLSQLADEGYKMIGVADPRTNPGTPTGKVMYQASAPGIYTNFGGIVVYDGEVAFLKFDTRWHKEETGVESREDFRPFGAMAASKCGHFLLDLNHVFSSDSLTYVPSSLYDSAWVAISEGATALVVSGATPYRFRFFSSIDKQVEDTVIDTNTTGEIPFGSKLALIAFRHADNPDGYAELEIKQDGWESMVSEYFPRGLYLARDKVLNVIGGTSIKFQTNQNWDCFIVFTQGASKIHISGLLSTANYRFFDSANIFDGSEIVSHHLGRNNTGIVPVGAVVCVVSMQKTDYPGGHSASVLDRTYNSAKKMRVLLIGNSATDDALSYVPFILQNMGVPVEIQIGIAMMSSSTLAMHLSNWENETEAYSFRLYDGGESWRNFSDKSLQWMLDNYAWDVISLQQAQPQKVNTYQPYLNKLINAISSYAHNAVKFIWYQTHIYSALSNGGAPRGDQTIGEYYADEVTACQNIVGASVCEYVVPVSTAIQNARSIPALKALGDYAQNENNDTGNGWLNYLDGVHLQEGLPCQIAAYTFVLAFLEIFGFEEFSINGESTRVTSEWTSGKNIPSPHGSPIGSTDANCVMAQKCAIMAHKHPYEVTDMNYIVDPTSES